MIKRLVESNKNTNHRISSHPIWIKSPPLSIPFEEEEEEVFVGSPDSEPRLCPLDDRRFFSSPDISSRKVTRKR